MTSSERERLIASCQGLVRSIAWKIHRKLPPQVDLDDLVGYGQVGLAEAARDFDPDRGGQFTTFAYYRVRGAILDGLAKMNWFNRADYNRGRYERLAHDVLEVEGHQGAAAADAPLEDDVRWLKESSGTLAMVHLMCYQTEDDDRSQPAIEDRSASPPPALAMKRELAEKLNELIDSLPTEAARLIRAAYFEGLTLTEAGKRLGVSKAWASRLHAKALAQLARLLRRAQMAD